MASVYSDKYWTGTYTYTRVRVDYSGTSATAHLLHSRTNTWTGEEWAYGATFKFGGASVTFSYNVSGLGQHEDVEIASVSFSISEGGGEYSGSTENANMGSFSGKVTIPAQYTAPAAPTATNLTSDGTPHKAYSKVANNGWGDNSTRSNYKIICNSAEKASDYSNDPASMYWTLPNGSNNTSACSVITWYGRATNNHNLSKDSAAKYIATPSAPKLTITAGSGTSPATTISGTVTYKGGGSNSTTCNTGTMKRWQFGKMLSSDSGIPSSFQSDTNGTTVTTKAYTWEKSEFSAGSNYKFYVRTVNTLGGASSSTSSTIYCPTGVSNSLSSRTTTSLTVKASYNYAGTVGSATSGDMACYSLAYGSSSSSLTNTIGPQTSNTFTISDLSPNQTVYYQVTAWNTYGLSNVSSVGNSTTIARYNPALTSATFSPNSPGADVAIVISQTGGLTTNELTVTGFTVERCPASSSTWETIKTVTGLSLSADDSYTISDLWGDSDADVAGDYYIRITTTNGTDTCTNTYTLAAPTTVTLSNVTVANSPIQIKATAAMTGSTAPYKYVFTTTGGAGPRTRTFSSTATSLTVYSPNYLLYDTTYSVTAKIFNAYGLWQSTSTLSTTTDKRVYFYYITGNTTYDGTLTFATHQTANVLTEKNISDYYYVVANALGDITTDNIGDNMNGKRLTFISQPLHYRPDSVASITFTNGKKLAYELDPDADAFKFAIWDGTTPETVFYDDSSWQMSTYDFPDNYVISAISPSDSNLNLSAPFSTTSLTDIPDWEQGE